MKTKIIVTGLMVSIASVQTEAMKALKTINSATYDMGSHVVSFDQAARYGLNDFLEKIIANARANITTHLKKNYPNLYETKNTFGGQSWQKITILKTVIKDFIQNPGMYVNFVTDGLSQGLKSLDLTDLGKLGTAVGTFVFSSKTNIPVLYYLDQFKHLHDVHGLMVPGKQMESSINLLNTGSAGMQGIMVTRIVQELSSLLISEVGFKNSDNLAEIAMILMVNSKIRDLASNIVFNLIDKMEQLCNNFPEFLSAACAAEQISALPTNNPNSQQDERLTKAFTTLIATSLAYLVVTRVLPKACNVAKKIFGK